MNEFLLKLLGLLRMVCIDVGHGHWRRFMLGQLWDHQKVTNTKKKVASKMTLHSTSSSYIHLNGHHYKLTIINVVLLFYIQKNNWTVNSILSLNEIFVLLSFDIWFEATGKDKKENIELKLNNKFNWEKFKSIQHELGRRWRKSSWVFGLSFSL